MRAEVITALFVAAMFATSAFMVYGEGPGSPSLTVTVSSGMATVDYSMPSSTHPYPSALMVLPVNGYRSDDIAILMTGKSGPPNSDPANVQGLADHLKAELENIGSSSKVTLIDEASLESFLAAGNGTLVIASVVNVTQSQLLEGWIMAGGLLIAIGPECIPFIGHGGSLGIGFDRYAVDEQNAEGSLAHDIGLRVVYPSYGMVVADVQSQSGTVLGHTSADGTLTTAAVVPMGEGRVLIMGGPIESPFLASMEDVFAWDLARLLEAGALWVTGPIYHERLEVTSQGMKGKLTFDIGEEVVRISLFSLDDSHALFRGATLIP